MESEKAGVLDAVLIGCGWASWPAICQQDIDFSDQGYTVCANSTGAAMIFDLRNPSVSDWHEHLADDHERINFPDTHFQFLLKIANALLKKQLIDELQWLDMYDIALGARDDAHEKQAIHPCAIVMSERQALVDVETGQVRGHTKHGTFRLDGMDEYCHFTRDPSGRMTARDKKLYQEYGRFESEDLVRIEGRLYRISAC